MASTSYLPLTLGASVLGRTVEPGEDAPEVIRVNGQCWRLVTDPKALEAYDVAAIAQAEARYAPRIANRAPTLADGEGKPEGAGWHQYALTVDQDGVEQDRLIQTWMWTGTQWVRLDMDPVMLPVVNIGTGTFGDLSGERVDVTGTLTARIVNAMDTATKRLVVTEDAILQHVTVIESIVAPEIVGVTGYFENLLLGRGANRIPNGDLAMWARDTDGEQTSELAGFAGNGWSVESTHASEVGYEHSISKSGRVNGVSDRFPVEPGETYFFSVWARGDRAGKRFYVQLRTDGSSSPYALSDETTPDKLWARYEGQVTMPADATEAWLNIYLNHANGTSTAGAQWFTGFELRRAASGNLLVPGAITARQITLTGNPSDPDEAALAAALAEIIKLKVGHLVVEDQADINGARLIGETFAESLTVTDKIIGADGIFTGTVDFANVNVTGDMLANMIMAASGLIAGNPSGERLEITGQGMVLYGLDADGIEYEMVRIGPSGTNLLTIGDTTISPDGVQSASAAFGELTVGGDDIVDMLAAFPRGRVAQNRYVVNSDYSDRAQSRLSTQFTVEVGRQYRLNVSPFYVQAMAPTDVSYRLVYSWDNLSTTWDERGIAQGRTPLPNTNPLLVPGLSADLPTANSAGPREIYVTLLVQPAQSAVRVVGRSDYPLTLSVDDVGPRVEDSGSYWTIGNVTEGSTPPPPDVPTVTRQTITWNAGGFGGDVGSGEVIQGTYGSYGNRSGGWIFHDAMRSALSGSTIEKFEVYLYAAHWYYGAGGIASIRPNNGAYKGFVGTAFTSSNWPRNAGRWVTVPSSWHASIANGTYRGIGVQTSNTGLSYYGRFTGSATKFRVTFRK